MSSENNGGKTNYYDLPLPDRETLNRILLEFHNGQGLTRDIENTLEAILVLCPQTLNDLIEYKQMQPWQHEVFKATYALHERAKKSKSYSIEREINKIIYYANRGFNLVRKSK